MKMKMREGGRVKMVSVGEKGRGGVGQSDKCHSAKR